MIKNRCKVSKRSIQNCRRSWIHKGTYYKLGTTHHAPCTTESQIPCPLAFLRKGGGQLPSRQSVNLPVYLFCGAFLISMQAKQFFCIYAVTGMDFMKLSKKFISAQINLYDFLFILYKYKFPGRHNKPFGILHLIYIYWCKHFRKKVYREKYEIPLDWVWFEPTPATTAAPSPSESGDITTAPLRLLKNKFHGTVSCLIALNDPSDRVYIWCASALNIYKELSRSMLKFV